MDALPPTSAIVTPVRPSAALGIETSVARELCAESARVDWAYLGALVLADAGTVALDSQVFQSSGQTGVRLVGPGLVGLSWGWSVGAIPLAVPQCSGGRVPGPPPEGETRSVTPLAVSFGVIAGVMGPVIVGVETGQGNSTLAWSPAERVMRLVIAGATGVGGSLLPYVLPPRTWRALRKLDRLRAGGDTHGLAISYAVTF